MIIIKHSKWKGHDTIELHRNGRFVLAFGKTKARAIVEAMKQDDTYIAISDFADAKEDNGHAPDIDLI